MKLISLNVAKPRLAVYKGATISTGIFKEPIAGPVQLSTLNLEGDRQADLSVHGGPHKAVYAYPSEHYAYWQREFPGLNLPWGMFGENFTTSGLGEDECHVGDRFKIGSATIMVRQPRVPCYRQVSARRHLGAVPAQRSKRFLFFGGKGRTSGLRRYLQTYQPGSMWHYDR